MSTDLHERLTAAVRERLEVARAATLVDGPFDGSGIVVMPLHGGGLRTVTLPSDVARFLATNDPATVIRHCERDLRVLERHAPVEVWAGWEHLPEADPGHRRVIATECGWCVFDTCPEESAAYDCRHTNRTWPCTEILELAAAYGIEVDGG